MIASEKKLIILLWVLVFTPIVTGFFLPPQVTLKVALASLFGVLVLAILLVRIRQKEQRPLFDTTNIRTFLLGVALALAMAWLMDHYYFTPQANQIIEEHLPK